MEHHDHHGLSPEANRRLRQLKRSKEPTAPWWRQALDLPGAYSSLLSMLLPGAYILAEDPYYLALAGLSALWAIWQALVALWGQNR